MCVCVIRWVLLNGKFIGDVKKKPILSVINFKYIYISVCSAIDTFTHIYIHTNVININAVNVLKYQ